MITRRPTERGSSIFTFFRKDRPRNTENPDERPGYQRTTMAHFSPEAFVTIKLKSSLSPSTPMKIIPRSIRFIHTLTAAALVCTSLLAVSTAAAQEATIDQTTAKARRIEGLWDSQANIINPQTGATLRTFRGLTMFIQGGSLTATNNQPATPTTTGPQFGRWEYLGHKQYTASFRFFRFNADGSFAGSQQVTRTFTVANGAQSFTGTLKLEILDASDNVIQMGQGTETSVRVQ